MTVAELEHKVEYVENAAGRNVDINFLAGLIATGIWQVALGLAQLNETVSRQPVVRAFVPDTTVVTHSGPAYEQRAQPLVHPSERKSA